MPRSLFVSLWPATRRVWLACGVLLVLGMGCGLFRIPEPPPVSTPEAPQWDAERLRDHLTLFAERTAEPDRDDATVGQMTAGQMRGRTRAAAYIAARLRESLVQPAFNTAYQQRYEAPPLSLTLGRLVGPDTLALVFGSDYVLDARTGADTLSVREVLPLRGDADSLALAQAAGRTVLVQSREVTDDLFQRLEQAGAASVWQVGPLAPSPARSATAEMAVMQVTTTAAANLLGLPLAALASAFEAPEVRPLRAPVALETVRRELPPVDALNVLGYVAGQDPLRQDELVIVCADLDALTASADPRAAMGSSLGAAATLELARAYAAFGEWTTTPQRTLLFAVWSGGAEGYAGLQAYLRRPLWTLEQTVRLVYIGLPEADRPVVEALAATAGLPLTIVPLPEGVAARYRETGPGAPPPARLLDAAIADALALLEQAHRTVLGYTDVPRPSPSVTPSAATPR